MEIIVGVEMHSPRPLKRFDSYSSNKYVDDAIRECCIAESLHMMSSNRSLSASHISAVPEVGELSALIHSDFQNNDKLNVEVIKAAEVELKDAKHKVWIARGDALGAAEAAVSAAEEQLEKAEKLREKALRLITPCF